MPHTLLAGPLGRARTWVARQRATHHDGPVLVLLGALALLLTAAGVAWPGTVAISSLLLPMFLGTLWLTPRSVPWLIVGCLAGVSVITISQPVLEVGVLSRLAITFVIALILLRSTMSRRRLGVTTLRSDSMFVDLRDRIVKQGQLPDLPPGWYAQTGIRAAGGTAFSGDFVVAVKDVPRRAVELVMVDVSGKGVEAGTRSLLLSGAFGGLLSALTPKDFLVEANNYLLRQQWEEGFATAIHLHLNVDTGDFELRKAGHPPAIWLKGGSGTWQVLDSDGPVLGLVPAPSFEPVAGRLQASDALMLYTDGLVETTDRDLHSGIDKLAGRGQLLMQRGFEGGAAWIIDEIGDGHDDRALILLHRR